MCHPKSPKANERRTQFELCASDDSLDLIFLRELSARKLRKLMASDPADVIRLHHHAGDRNAFVRTVRKHGVTSNSWVVDTYLREFSHFGSCSSRGLQHRLCLVPDGILNISEHHEAILGEVPLEIPESGAV